MVVEINFSSETGMFSAWTEDLSKYCYKPKKFCMHIWTCRVETLSMTESFVCLSSPVMNYEDGDIGAWYTGSFCWYVA